MQKQDTSESIHLAVDLGASSGRVIQGHLEGGVLDREEIHRFETPLEKRKEGMFWDIQEIEREVRRGIETTLEASPRPDSLSVDSWGVDYVPLDGQNQPIGDPHAYWDSRTEGWVERAFEVMSQAEIYEHTGIQFMELNTMFQLLAERDRTPERFERIHRILMMGDYMLYRLGGRQVAERTLASTTQMLDVDSARWCEEILQAFELPARILPSVVPSGSIIGRYPDESDETGSLPVVAGCSHDTACAVAATPGSPSRTWAYLSCGTWSLLGVERQKPLVNERAMEANFTNERGLDNTIRFLTNLTGLFPLEQCRRAWLKSEQDADYEELLQEARHAESMDGFVDLGDPRFQEPGRMPEKWRVWCREHGLRVPDTRGQMVRHILESLADSHREAIRELETLIPEPIEVLHIVGGGSRNELLCQWTSDACRLPVKAGPAEATATGNILVQARAVETLPSDTTIREVVRKSDPPEDYQPRSPDRTRWGK